LTNTLARAWFAAPRARTVPACTLLPIARVTARMATAVLH
jgi:hypothetical protein